MVKEKIFYLTKKGLEGIKKEYRILKALRFTKTKGEVPKILESEDLNPEYLSFREDLSFLETRITELENVLKNAKLITLPPKNKQNIIDLGATIVAEVERDRDEFTIVGTLEANPSLGKISNESPVGRALMGHKVGDEIVVSSPIKVIYKILKIRYFSL
jgi:transcription elongation factor GreA